MGEPSGEPPKQLNVLGLPIELCCQDPVTGFFRDGHILTYFNPINQAAF